MSLSLVHSRAQIGVDAPAVTVEVHLANGLPSLTMVGLPEAAVKESKDRVRSAIINSGLQFPARRITLNLAPADLPKDGGRFDLAIALGILSASVQVPTLTLDDVECLGELALSGAVRAVRGVLPAALAARKAGRSLMVPRANAEEACLASGLKVIAVDHLLQAVAHFNGHSPVERYAPAQTNLGASYLEGTGVEKDAQQAVFWYRKAAEQGNADAQFFLGISYFNGTGVEKDSKKAVDWYRKAAEQGYAPAQKQLDAMIENAKAKAVEDAKAKAVEAAKAQAVRDAKVKAAENATAAKTQSKAIEIANDAKSSGGLSEALQNNKDKGLDWFKNKIFKLDKASAITACDPGICYIFAFNGLSSLGITQEDGDFNGRQLQGQLVRVIGTDRFGNIVVTRLNANDKPTQKPRPTVHEKPRQKSNLPSPALATYDEIVNSIDGLIVARTAEGWARPESTREDMTVVLQIEMLQDGTIKSVSVARSSGDAPFDHSAVTAVKDIGSLPEMQYLKPNDFQPYRSFKMTFRPEDLALEQ